MYTKKELERIKNTDSDFAWANWQSAMGFNDGVKLGNKLMKRGYRKYCYRDGFFNGLKSVIVEDIKVFIRIKVKMQKSDRKLSQ